MHQIALDSDGAVTIGAGALYGTLKKLVSTNLIEEMPFEGDPRRRYYRLTVKGWERLEADITYYSRIASQASERHITAAHHTNR